MMTEMNDQEKIGRVRERERVLLLIYMVNYGPKEREKAISFSLFSYRAPD
jgi:hypothetical protein